MVKRVTVLVIFAAIVGLGAAAGCRGAEGGKGDAITVTGVVTPAKAGAEEAATVLADKVVYRIVKDAKGGVVAKNAGGKKVEIRGTVAERDGVKWITVSWCAVVE